MHYFVKDLLLPCVLHKTIIGHLVWVIALFGTLGGGGFGIKVFHFNTWEHYLIFVASWLCFELSICEFSLHSQINLLI